MKARSTEEHFKLTGWTLIGVGLTLFFTIGFSIKPPAKEFTDTQLILAIIGIALVLIGQICRGMFLGEERHFKNFVQITLFGFLSVALVFIGMLARTLLIN